ncbi:MAG: DUF1631 family protein [Candidatus Accumulibacter sp.]|uniref:DUF1631 family protein n=1 Tax=Accumulibacter sp. TaxID=2053492 RepID=UPI00258340C4|nr:DUF1631 family protein [Accumulibacter sp.]MBK8113078.1 DUF1631 family protein [Accumulibacter sp.]
MPVLRASKALFLSRLTEIVNRCAFATAPAFEAFTREVGEAHDQAASASPRDDFEQTSQLTASRLTLMGDDDLELDIRIGEIGSRLRETAGRDLWRSQSRYMTLLSRPAMNEDSNPLGPEVICLGLWALCKACGGSHEQQHAMLDWLERALGQQLPALYRDLDQLLAGYGIEPVQGASAPVVTTVAAAVGSAENQAAPGNALSLQQAVRRLGNEQTGAPVDFFGDGSARSGNATLDAAAMVMLNHLLDRLTALESRSAHPAIDTGAAELPAPAPLCALTSKDLDLPLGKPEAIAIDTMALIFESIFDSSDLPDTIKAAIGRLQIPLLKLAIVDPSLFTNDHHPARLLINRMARAAVGLPRNTGWEHPICQRIGRLTAAARIALDTRGAPLDAHLADLDTLIRERDQSIRRAAENSIQMVVEHENRQYAEQLAATWLRGRLARTRSPEVASFLEKYWLRVMVAAVLEDGAAGKRWQESSTTGDELIWSVQPKQSAEERKRLASLASSLVRRIGAGLDAIGVPAAERSPFLNALFDLQTAALRSQAPTPPSPGTAADSPRAVVGGASPAAPRVLERDGWRVHYLGMPSDTRSPHTLTVANWQVGDWLRFRMANTEPLCGLGCWQNPSSGTILFFNPDWPYAVAMSAATVDQQIRSGRAQLVSRVPIFDAAAERALGLLEKR